MMDDESVDDEEISNSVFSQSVEQSNSKEL